MSMLVPVRLLLAAAGVAGLLCLGTGLVRLVVFERTPGQVADARSGALLATAGCALLLVVAALAVRAAPTWVPLAVAAPAVVCGGLALVASGTLFPQLAALPAFAVGLAGLVGLVVGGGRGT